MNENHLTKDLISRISVDFEIHQEVEGYHQFCKERLRIDLVLRAKPHLIDQGFTNEWFGIECKWVTGHDKQTSKVTRLVWQCITYAQSVFWINGSQQRLRFVAAYTPQNLNTPIENTLTNLLTLGHHGCVGRFYFYRNADDWGIRFSNIYASKTDQNIFVNEHRLPKLKAGSI